MADYWIYTSERRDPIALSGVTEIRRVKCRVPNGKYRDGTNFPVGLADGTTSAGSAESIPVRGTTSLSGVANIATSVAALVSDEALNIPPRQDYRIEAGYAVAIDSPLPILESLPWTEQNYGRTLPGSTAATLALPQRRFTATGHAFVTNDLVTMSATTLPSIVGADAGLLVYRVVVLGVNTVQLLNNATGLVPNFAGGGGSGIELALFQPAPRQLPNTASLTADHTTESFTYTPGTRSFVSGDLVKLYGTLPTGGTFAFNTAYEVLFTSVSSFQLLNDSTKALMTFTGNGSGIVAQLVTPATVPEFYDVLDLDRHPNVLFFPDSVTPLVSNVDPNA